ncbi:MULTISPECIES: LysR family transcriptional regulator [Burkholderia]|uniref:LysR family transcriptional regulator n=1 Tax=Burkholderia TaxID=32008 RepID=UPI0005B36DD8|nr:MULTISPECIES: LysR family transcriptional regulator [Burkholderia]MBA9945192.1 LysR family transcriptional regulator [Burkholderia cepacia]MBA9975642.1 LysR family transcriptional regulator [Burkholderia cepacia]MBA9993839.1 LysR family transcriptional regulator [Burkholderia cepacia]MBB0001918.1 LysR family transcriptional regulator [Burkholderia cepacia]MBB0009920.1 LysR family transcriptional regulator [Burkholderia cepacia]
MDNLQNLQAFLRTIEMGNFSAVGRDQGISQSAVSKQIASLEATLGIQLFRRTTRKLSPTDEALQLYPHVRQLLDAVDVVKSEVHGLPAEGIGGTLRITMPSSFGRNVVMPLLPQFLERHPRLVIDIAFAENMLDLVEEGMELGIRVGELPPSTLIARALGVVQQRLVATPRYLSLHGRPESPIDLADHSCIAYGGAVRFSRWEFESEHGRQAVDISGAIRVNDIDAIYDAMLADLGVAVVPEWKANEDVTAGRVESLMPEYYPMPLNINIVYPQTRFLSQRARSFIDFLVGCLKRA